MGPSSQGSPVRHVQYQNPGSNYNPMSPTNQGVYVHGQPPMGGYPIHNYGLSGVSSIPPHMMSQIVNQDQQHPSTDPSIQARESLGHVTISGPAMVNIIYSSVISPLLYENNLGLPHQTVG